MSRDKQKIITSGYGEIQPQGTVAQTATAESPEVPTVEGDVPTNEPEDDKFYFVNYDNSISYQPERELPFSDSFRPSQWNFQYLHTERDLPGAHERYFSVVREATHGHWFPQKGDPRYPFDESGMITRGRMPHNGRPELALCVRSKKAHDAECIARQKAGDAKYAVVDNPSITSSMNSLVNPGTVDAVMVNAKETSGRWMGPPKD